MQTLKCAASALLAVLLFSIAGAWANGQRGPEDSHRMKIILDTDIGDDIDDVYALALVATRPNVQLLGVTTAWGYTKERAQLAAKFLKVIGKGEIPVYAGRRGDFKIRDQYEWAKDYAGRNIKSEEAVAFLKRSIEQHPGEITLVAVGPLTTMRLRSLPSGTSSATPWRRVSYTPAAFHW